MFEQFFGINLWSIAKAFLIFANVIYLVFAFVVVRQVKLMTDTLEMGYEFIIKLISYGHLIFALLILLYSIWTL